MGSDHSIFVKFVDRSPFPPSFRFAFPYSLFLFPFHFPSLSCQKLGEGAKKASIHPRPFLAIPMGSEGQSANPNPHFVHQLALPKKENAKQSQEGGGEGRGRVAPVLLPLFPSLRAPPSPPPPPSLPFLVSSTSKVRPPSSSLPSSFYPYRIHPICSSPPSSSSSHLSLPPSLTIVRGWRWSSFSFSAQKAAGRRNGQEKRVGDSQSHLLPLPLPPLPQLRILFTFFGDRSRSFIPSSSSSSSLILQKFVLVCWSVAEEDGRRANFVRDGGGGPLSSPPIRRLF